jgi:hypothetical protein
LAPAFVQENYISVRPMNCDAFSHMDRCECHAFFCIVYIML